MTAGEAEHFYEDVDKGMVTKIPETVFGHMAPRADLRTRQAEELELGAFRDVPHFRNDLLMLCQHFGTQAWNTYVDRTFTGYRRDIMADLKGNFEMALVTLREYHNRPVWSDEQVRQAIEKANIFAKTRAKAEAARARIDAKTESRLGVPARGRRWLAGLLN